MAKIKNASELHALFSKIVESSIIRILYQSDKVNHMVHAVKYLSRSNSVSYA